jgi:hypothetical protein
MKYRAHQNEISKAGSPGRLFAHPGDSEEKPNREEAVGGNPIDDKTLHF